MSLVLIEYLTRASYVMYDIPRLQINREIETKIKNHARNALFLVLFIILGNPIQIRVCCYLNEMS